MGRGWLRGTVVLLVILLAAVEGYKILVVFPIAGKSHSILGEGYVKLLLKKGHEVTYITPFPMKINSPNFRQVAMTINITSAKEHEKIMNISLLLNGNSILQDNLAEPFLGHMIAERTMSDEMVLKFIEDPKQRFDAVVAEWFFSELYSGFAALYQCPMVWSSSLDVHPDILRAVDEFPNPAYTADAVSVSQPPFTFRQRTYELWTQLKKAFVYEFVLIPKAAEMYKNTFVRAASQRGIELPPYGETIYNASMTLANSHPSVGDAPKLAQNVKGVGGYHIEPATDPLPKNLQKIIDEAKNGVIYFSMGSNMKSKDLPQEMVRDLLNMFGQLKQTVLWKFEESFEGTPSNVHIQSWMPQHSILAHPNTKLFITHGGLLSTTETIYFGVPVVVIPLFGDQFRNADTAARKGYAVKVQFTYNLSNDLRAAIQQMLGNPSYATKTKELSAVYHDRPLPPADELVYWVEYAVRTRGARHLRSAALLLPWYQRLYLDLLALVLAALLAAVLAIRRLLRRAKPQDLKKKNK